MLAAELLRRMFGDAGVLIVAGLSGVADVDAVTISIARPAGQGIEPAVAVRGILLAVAVNTGAKAALAAWAGGSRVGITVGAISALALAAGFAAAMWMVLN